MPRRYDSEDTKRRALSAAAELFLQSGYYHTTIREICRKAGISTGSLYNVYQDKEAILYDLVEYMFGNQFLGARALLAEGYSMAKLYAMETSLQLAVTELNENIREIYLAAYTLPTTSAYIYRQAAKEIVIMFREQMPEYTENDFFECEIGTGNMIRGYMSIPCDETFTLQKKIGRFLDLSLAVYRIPLDERRKIIKEITRYDLRAIAERAMKSVVDWIMIGFPSSDGNLFQRISEYKQ